MTVHTIEVVLVLRFHAYTTSIHERRLSVLGSGWEGEERRVLGVVFAIDGVFDFYATTPTAVFM
jgi:hypothetical protein